MLHPITRFRGKRLTKCFYRAIKPFATTLSYIRSYYFNETEFKHWVSSSSMNFSKNQVIQTLNRGLTLGKLDKERRSYLLNMIEDIFNQKTRLEI